jgi:16S rRNA processing protein RimM
LAALTDSKWIAIAQLLRPQGRRGELLAEPLSDLPDIFAPGTEASLAPAGASAPSPAGLCSIQEHWFPTGKNAGRVVLKLSGCDSISAAEALSGKLLLIASAALPTLDEDTFFVGDLLGCAFYNGEHRAGTIVDVQFATGPDGRTRLEDAAPLLGIELAEGTEPVLVPFVRAWLQTVDLAQRRVVMHLPEGLLDGAYVPVEDPETDA